MTAEGFVDIWRERRAKARGYTWFNRRARGWMRRAWTTSSSRQCKDQVKIEWESLFTPVSGPRAARR